MLLSKNIVFFLHIPKCAGTSIGLAIDRILRPKNKFFWHGADGDVNKAFQRFESIEFSDNLSADNILSFIGGHFTIDLVNFFKQEIPADVNVMIVSIIRDPIKQAISYYNWITSESIFKGAPHPLSSAATDMTCIDFFSSEAILSEVKNIQSRYLFGKKFVSSNNNLLSVDQIFNDFNINSNIKLILYDFNTIDVAFKDICQHIGINSKNYKSPSHCNISNTFNFLDDTCLELINKTYDKDIELFNFYTNFYRR